MFTPFRFAPWSCIGIAALMAACLSTGGLSTACAQQPPPSQLTASLSSSLREASPAEVEAARQTAIQALGRLQAELSQQAIGVVLSQELKLAQLQAELQKPAPDPATLDAIRITLRRSLAGKVQQPVNELRASVARLAQLLGATPPRLERAREALTTINAHLADAQLRTTPEGESQLRQAYATLAAAPTSPADMEALRQRLSIANYATLIKTKYLVDVSRRNFQRPIQFQTCKDGTSITGQGSFRVDLSLGVPPSQNENLLVLYAHGCGQIDAQASRSRITASARARPQIEGSQAVHILPEKVVGDQPWVTARFSTQLNNVQMSGLLGRCQLLLRVLSRAIQTRLAANDSEVARQIEQTVRTKVEEEAYDLAHRINGMLHHGLWERVLSLDFVPAVRSYNDAEGVRSQTSSVQSGQLGALHYPPTIPWATYQQLDLVTWVHESAVNNVFESFGPIHLHEDTMRGLWQVQLKLTSPAWEQLQPARIPAVIGLADRRPVKLRLTGQGVEVTLRATSCELDGRKQDVAPCEAIIRYQLARDSSGSRFERQEIAFAHEISDADAAVWKKALTLFFAESMRPLPKFHNTSFSQFLQMGYLTIEDGWLVVGAQRVPEAPSGLAARSNESAGTR